MQFVPVLLVDRYWPQIREGMETACKRGGGQYTEGWLHAICRRGEAMLVADVEDDRVRAAFVLQEQNWSGRVVIFLHAACGFDMGEWFNALREFGAANFPGKPVIFEGRPGWGRMPGVKVVRHVFEVEAGYGGQ